MSSRPLLEDAGAALYALDALVGARADRVAAECRKLVLVARFADTVSVADHPERWMELFPGGDGTPGVEEFASDELGAVRRISSTAAWGLLADVLDLRHRLPRLGARVVAGEVEGWKARKVALRTDHLSLAAVRTVDTVGPRPLACPSPGRRAS